MHASEVMDLKQEPEYIHEMYGTSPGEESFANNCLLARRLVEQGVRYVQLYDWGWDHHGNGDNTIDKGLKKKCGEIDRPIAALLKDLKQRGLLDDTLVVWGGEFGRTNYCQGKMTANNFGRDHHPRCFTMWMAGGGVKPGYSHGITDDYCYNIVQDGVHVHDLSLIHI